MCQRVLARAFCLLFPFCDCLQEDIINLVIYKVQKLAAMLESEGFMYVYVVRGRLFKKGGEKRMGPTIELYTFWNTMLRRV